MAEYRRFISYIYLYEGGLKSENTGFVRVENRSNECRIHIHMTKLSHIFDGEYTAYMLCRENSRYIGIRIGQLNQEASGTDWEFTTDSEHLMGTEYKLEHISGMIIQGDNGTLYGTRWDDEPLEINCFYEKDRISENIVCFGFHETDNDSKRDQETETIMVTALDGQEELRTDPYAQAMQRFPQIHPFNDDRVEECVRLELQDIGHLPMCDWFYAGNRFLLHGYDCYKHLILAKIQDGAYILGVPGTWQHRERYMASTSGFKNFKPVSQSDTSEGTFGYWYIEFEEIYHKQTE